MLSALLKGKALIYRLWAFAAILAAVVMWRAAIKDYRDRTDRDEIPPGVIPSYHSSFLALSGMVGTYGIVTLFLGRLWWW